MDLYHLNMIEIQQIGWFLWLVWILLKHFYFINESMLLLPLNPQLQTFNQINF